MDVDTGPEILQKTRHATGSIGATQSWNESVVLEEILEMRIPGRI